MPLVLNENGELVYQEGYTPRFSQLPNTLGVDLKKYEPYIGGEAEYIKGPYNQQQWDDERAENQSGFAKFGNSVGQGLGTFTTALASTVTTLGSLPFAIGEGIMEGSAQKGMDVLINNPIMQGINEFDKYLKEDLLPTYYTKEQQESLFNASKGTDLLNGLGFLASNVIPNAAVVKLFGNFSKMANAAKAGKLVGVLDKAVDAGQITNAEKMILGGVGKYFEKAPAMIGATVGRIGESAMEAYGTYEQVKQSLEAESKLAQQELEIYGTTDKRILTPEQIEAEAKKQRDNVFGGNMTLSFSDMLQFTRWFKGDNIADRFIKDGLKTTVRQLGKGDLIKSLIKESTQEAAEEGYQFLLSKGAEKSAKGKSFIEGVSEASGELFTTIEGQKSMLLGAILGGGVGTALNVRNEKELKPELEKLAANLTLTGNTTDRYIITPEGKRIINPELSKIATNFMFYEQQKQKAIEEGNQQAYDLAEKMQFSDLVAAKQDAGQLEDFISELKEMAKATPEEVESMFGELPTRNGRKLTPQEIVAEKIQLAERVQELNNGLSKLPALQGLPKAAFGLVRHNLFTQEALRNELEKLDLEIATVKGKAVNEYDLVTGEVTEGKLLPFDKLQLEAYEEARKIVFDNYAEVTKKFNELIKNPETAVKEVNKAQDNAVKQAVTEVENTIKETETLVKESEESKDIVDNKGNEFTFIAENEDGSIVVEDKEGNVFIQSKEQFNKNFKKEELTDTEETNDLPVTPEDERLAENNDRFVDPDSNKKFTILSSSGQAIQLDGNEVIIEEGEAVIREEFKQQTETFNKPTTSNNIVTTPSDKPNVIQFKAEEGTIENLEETNKRRVANGLDEINEADLESDEFTPIKLTVVINGRANNSITHYFHTPDYYYRTAEYEQIEKSDLTDEAKKKLHEANLEKYKRIRSQLVQAIKNNKSVILNTVSKSTGVLNYNPRVDGQRKTDSVLTIFEEATVQEFIAPKSHNLYIIENGKAQQIKTKGLRIITNVEQLEDGSFKITTLDSVLGKNEFISRFEYGVGEMLYDVVAPNGSVLTITPFTKKGFNSEQIDGIANLLLHRLTNDNIIEVNGQEKAIVGTESNPGIVDSLIYIGTVKSKSSEAINSQLVFAKDGTLLLGKQKIIKEDPEAFDKIKAHLLQYKSKPQFKMRSKDIESFGIPTQTEKGWKIEKPTSYLNFMFKGENALIQTALNKTKFVNSYFNFATDNNGDLLISGKKDVSKETSQIKSVSNIEAKKAEIERRRQEELLIPQSLDKLPGYLAEGIIKAVEQLSINQRYEIVKQAISGKTAQQIVSELNLIDADGRRNTEIVRQVRAYYGIPSQDTEGYQEWKNKVDKINAKYDAEIAALEQQESKPEINNAVKEKENECTTGKPSDLTGFDLFD